MTLRGRSLAVVLAVVVGASAGGCRERIPPPTTPAPSIDRPGSIIPGDLDVAVRLDVDAARRVLGPAVARALELDLVDPAADPVTAELLARAIADASTIWVALRPGLPPRLTDNVLACRGRFGPIEPHRPGSDWTRGADLGGAWRRHERPAPERRSAPSRIYVRANDWLVFVSEAEVDSAERAIERRAGDDHVDPEERGLLSFSARVGPLLPLLEPRFPAVAEALAGARKVDGVLDGDERGLRASVEVRFDDAEQAGQARERAAALLEVLKGARGPLGPVARGAEAAVVGTNLVLRGVIDAAALPDLAGEIGAPPR